VQQVGENLQFSGSPLDPTVDALPDALRADVEAVRQVGVVQLESVH
jgi:hypothetical protein